MPINKLKNSTSLIIMAKEPVVGSTKTRLCPPLSLKEAALLYEALLWDTIHMTASIQELDLAIAITPPDSAGYFEQIAPKGTVLIPVDCPDIGQCLTFVLDQLLEMGYQKVMALNSDGPTLPPVYIQKAIKSLDQHDLVLGPADDGGYYLVGLTKLHEDIFKDIDWSTDQVLAQTLRNVERLRLTAQLLPSWYDVDTAADIHRLREELKTLPTKALQNTRQFLNQW